MISYTLFECKKIKIYYIYKALETDVIRSLQIRDCHFKVQAFFVIALPLASSRYSQAQSHINTFRPARNRPTDTVTRSSGESTTALRTSSTSSSAKRGMKSFFSSCTICIENFDLFFV